MAKERKGSVALLLVVMVATVLLVTYYMRDSSKRKVLGEIFMNTEKLERPEYCTVFTHMVKSGGTTIKEQLVKASRHEGARMPGMACSTTAEILMGTKGKCPQNMQNSSVMCSPMAELLRLPLEAAGRQCEYFTMMRHPIDRLVSAFFYCPTNHDLNRKASKWCSGPQDESSAKPLLVEYATTHWKNMAMRQLLLSSYCPSRYHGFCPRNQATLGSYTAVGIFEEFDLSMALFDAKVRSPVRHWNADTVKNPGKKSSMREGVLAWAHTSMDVRRFLQPDMLIYEFAVSVFKEQTAAELGIVWP